MGSWRNRWLLEGDFISFIDPTVEGGIERFFFIKGSDFAHIEWEFGLETVDEEDRPVNPGETAGPYMFEGVKPTFWSDKTGQGQMFQWIFGLKPDVKVYIQLPADLKRHGTPKYVWPKKGYPQIAHFTMEMSPFDRPTFFTEHFLIPKLCDNFGFECYNPLPITVTPHLNFYINKLDLEWIGDVNPDGTRNPSRERYRDVLENLYKRVAKYRPITLFPVSSAAAQR